MAQFGACRLATNMENAQIVVLLRPMTAEERAEVEQLCLLIQNEKDDDKFVELVDQLDLLFKRKERRLNSGSPPTDKPPAQEPEGTLEV